MLKEAVVGGPSLVFTRYHEVGQTKIRDHQYEDARTCKTLLDCDASALYLSTTLNDMPCGKERVFHFQIHRQGACVLTQKFKAGTWFGFAEVDIEIPKHLWPKFEEMCPFFLNKEVPVGPVPEHMVEYLQKTGRNRANGKKLVEALSAKKLLLYAPLLR